MKTIIADRGDFFVAGCCPIALRRIRSDTGLQHPGDLTDVPHTHNFAELVIIVSGSGRQRIDRETTTVAAGDVFLIQGNIVHCFVERCGLGMYNIMFDDRFLGPHLQSLRSLPGFNAFFLFEPNYRKRHKFGSRLRLSGEALLSLGQVLHQMEAEAERRAPGWDLALLARVLEIFVTVSREYARVENPMARSLCRLGEVVSRLENDYRRHWTVAGIARIASLAPSTLLPVFKAVTGYSPIDYLLRVRLAKAAELLRQTGLSISEVAAECGFADSNYFSRQFKAHYQTTPRDYRFRR